MVYTHGVSAATVSNILNHTVIVCFTAYIINWFFNTLKRFLSSLILIYRHSNIYKIFLFNIVLIFRIFNTLNIFLFNFGVILNGRALTTRRVISGIGMKRSIITKGSICARIFSITIMFCTTDPCYLVLCEIYRVIVLECGTQSVFVFVVGGVFKIVFFRYISRALQVSTTSLYTDTRINDRPSTGPHLHITGTIITNFI
mmetsp:Transcript_11664/g.25605  ORF Transcript_11664/g.25605 Transcript_11664/m.25605 type:complete len:200 (-) Transcript_11664:294-893(-)